MMRSSVFTLTMLLAVEAACAEGDSITRVTVERNVRNPMRDGITFGPDVYRPDAFGRFSALMLLRYYTVATLKCPVSDRFSVLIAERGWTRQNGPAIDSADVPKENTPYVHAPRIYPINRTGRYLRVSVSPSQRTGSFAGMNQLFQIQVFGP